MNCINCGDLIGNREIQMTSFAQINVKWNMNWNTIENEKSFPLT